MYTSKSEETLKKTPKLGELLVAKGVISSMQLQTALKEQIEHGGKLGTILSSMRFATPQDIDKAIPPFPSSRLGERLLGNQVISKKQLETALLYQRENGGLLGETLVELGYVSPEVITQNLLMMNRRIPLGEMLVDSGVISFSQLNTALTLQKKSGGFLGDILLSLKMVSPDALYRQLSSQNKMGRPGIKVDLQYARELPFDLARKYNAAIISSLRSYHLLAVTSKLSPSIITELEITLRKPVEQVLVSQPEVDSYWAHVYGEELSWESTLKLAEEQPYNSASQTISIFQGIQLILLTAIVILSFVFYGFVAALVANVLVQIVYFLMIVFKMFILVNGASADTQIRITKDEIKTLDERKLPVYSILIPMYKEKESVKRLLQNIGSLDYPKSKLDVRILLEEDDLETIKIVHSMELPSYFTVMVVPRSIPKTKPKACNYGLIKARGEYVVIFDAEDKPEPDQLKKAYIAFQRLPEKCACVQAKLNYYNSKQNILTKWFTQEYSMWFEMLLPGVMRLNIPLPLGGSSNHFKTDILKFAGAWDPFNVTEDADLGIRLYKDGFTTVVLASRTWEEAPSVLPIWINQRSRWLKGYMQTWLVHMRHPFKLMKTLHLRGFIGFQAMVFGTFFLPLINPVFWLLLILWFTTQANWISQLFPSAIYYASLFLLIFGNFFFIYTSLVGVYWVIHDISQRNGTNGDHPLPFSYEIVIFGILSPVYWVLMSIASYKAVWQLVFKPFHWEKTSHGLFDHKHDSVGDIYQSDRKETE